MKRFFVSSHGHCASGMQSSLGILIGKVPGMTVFDAYLDENTVEQQVEDFFRESNEGDQIILLSDLYGGSVNSVLSRYLDRPNTILISGYNLALLLQLAISAGSDDNLSEAQLEEMIESSRQGMRLVKLDDESLEEEDFFG